MQTMLILRRASAIVVLALMAMNASPAAARCYTFQESHNGTDLFNPGGGAKTAAEIKLRTSIELWQKKKGVKKVRIGKVEVKCDPWNMNYIIPHHRCYARARVCH